MSAETETLDPDTTVAGLPVGDDGTALPLQDVVTGRGFITGKSGAGKSNSGGVLTEELLDRGVPVTIIDPDGEHAAIAADYDLLHAGPAADPAVDVTLTTDNASRIAATAYRERVPLVLDLTGIYGDDAQQELVADVCRRLFHLATREKAPTLLLIEELHEWAPTRGGGDAHDAIIKIAKRGRKHGLGVVGLTQRPAAASKGFITQADWLSWHRLTWSNDLDVVGDVLGTEYEERVEALATGEAVLQADWNSAAERVRWRRKRTPDEGAAPDALAAVNSTGDVTDDLLDELHATDDDGDDAEGGSCADCPFCRAGVQPPAHLADAIAADGGDVIAMGAVHALGSNSKRWRAVGRMFEGKIADGDTVSVGLDGDDVRLWYDDRGMLEYTAHDTADGPQVSLTARALDLLAAEAGDHVRVVDDDQDGQLLDRVTDRADALDGPILGRKQPYTTKSDGDDADSVHFGKSISLHLGLDHDGSHLTVRDAGERLIVVPGDVEGLATYKVGEIASPYIGAKGLKPLGATEGDEIVARPDGPEQIVLTARPVGGEQA